MLKIWNFHEPPIRTPLRDEATYLGPSAARAVYGFHPWINSPLISLELEEGPILILKQTGAAWTIL